MSDNRPFSFMAWSRAIEHALESGGDLESIRQSATNIGVGMGLSREQLGADCGLFNWTEVEKAVRLAALRKRTGSRG